MRVSDETWKMKIDGVYVYAHASIHFIHKPMHGFCRNKKKTTYTQTMMRCDNDSNWIYITLFVQVAMASIR